MQSRKLMGSRRRRALRPFAQAFHLGRRRAGLGSQTMAKVLALGVESECNRLASEHGGKHGSGFASDGRRGGRLDGGRCGNLRHRPATAGFAADNLHRHNP